MEHDQQTTEQDCPVVQETGDRNVEVEVSLEGAQSLLDLLFERGYFDNVRTMPDENVSKILVRNEKSKSSFFTIHYLAGKGYEELTKCGRLEINIAATSLGVAVEEIPLVCEAIMKEKHNEVIRIGDELITTQCIENLREKALLRVKDQGCLSVIEIARKIYKLPLDFVDRDLQHLQGDNVRFKVRCTGETALLSNKYYKKYRENVLATFESCERPVSIRELAKEKAWDLSWIIEILHDAISLLPGELLGDDRYVPRVYVEKQREAIIDFFRTNGFVTFDWCQSQGASSTQMRNYIETEFPTAVALTGSVLHLDVFVDAIESAILGVESEGSWIDLGLYVPDRILDIFDDTKSLINMALGRIKGQGESAVGSVVFSIIGTPLYFSYRRLVEIREQVLPPLIEPFAKCRAIELMASTSSVPGTLSGKSSRTWRDRENQAFVEYGAVPWLTIATAIVEQFSDMNDLLRNNDSTDSCVLEQLVTTCFYNTEFLAACEQAVKIELDRLRAAQAARTTDSSSMVKVNLKMTEVSFEDSSCFANCCYMIQAAAKYLDYAKGAGLDDQKIWLLEKELLHGWCAEFTYRVTMYILIKNGVDDGLFSFGDGQTLPSYCCAVDLGCVRHPKIFLSARSDEERESRNPLQLLRELLPSGVGVPVARQWALCGGQCYEGGEKLLEDGTIFVRRGSLEQFLKHVEDNCLLICGLPFKKLDKKAEKQLLYARRQNMLKAATETTSDDPPSVLDRIVMILFQLVKNLVVSGPQLSTVALALLLKERKIATEVANALEDFAKKIEKNEVVSAEAVERMKGLAFRKDYQSRNSRV